MPKYFSRELLYRLRNEIPLERLIANHLNWPCKRREGRFCFVLPTLRRVTDRRQSPHKPRAMLPL